MPLMMEERVLQVLHMIHISILDSQGWTFSLLIV